MELGLGIEANGGQWVSRQPVNRKPNRKAETMRDKWLQLEWRESMANLQTIASITTSLCSHLLVHLSIMYQMTGMLILAYFISTDTWCIHVI